jgi:hypothetical protein
VSGEVLDWQIADRLNSKEARQQYRARLDEQDILAGVSFAKSNFSSNERKDLPSSGNCDTIRHIVEKAASFRMLTARP